MAPPVLLLAALAAIAVPRPADCRSWYVYLDGSGDAPTIQAAVDSAAASGDSILVGPGQYFQAVVINNKSLVMRSLEGRDQTWIIRNPAALTLSGTGTKKIVDVTFSGTAGANGLGTFDSCAFSFCVTGAVVPAGQVGSFTSCLFGPGGTGVSGRGTFIECEFSGNEIGASVTNSTFTNCEFSGNHDWGVSTFGSCTFTDCDIVDNDTGGLLANGDAPQVTTRLTNCTVSGNGTSAIFGTGGTGGPPPVEAVNVECRSTLVSDNGGLGGSGFVTFTMIDCEITGNGPSGAFRVYLTRCAVWGNASYLKARSVSQFPGELTMTESTYHANGFGISADPAFTNPGRVTVTRSIVSGTLDGRGVPQCSQTQFPELVLSVGCSDIFGNAGGDDVCPEAGANNFSLDPLFCDAAAGDFTLFPNSPCAPANSPAGCDLIGAFPVGCQIVGIDPAVSPPLRFGVGQNRPNPFNPSTVIDFTLPVAMPVALRIYDPAGRLVRTLVEETLGAGNHVTVWDGREASGGEAASGVYYYRLEGEGHGVATRKMLLVK
jgi:hypothetical protein